MNPHANRRESITFIVVALLIVVSALLGNAAQSILNLIFGESTSVWWQVFIFCASLAFLFFIYVFASRRLGTVFGSDVTMTMAEHEPALPYIITGYSPNTKTDALNLADYFVQHVPLRVLALPQSDFKQKIKEGKYPNLPGSLFLNWQQNIRSAYHHRDKLKVIYVLLPNEDDACFANFKRFMEGMFKKAGHEIEVVAITDTNGNNFLMTGRSASYDPPSYEDYDYVYEGLRRGLDMVMKLSKKSISSLESCVVIDTTPGVKIFSIAAATITLNMNLRFSYVNNSGLLKFYDAKLRIRYN